MTSQGTPHGRFARAIATGNLRAAEIAALELAPLSLEDALKLCVLLAERDPPRFERAARRWLERFLVERLPPIAEVALAAAALAELRHSTRGKGAGALQQIVQKRADRVIRS